jgi:hypothetical protein
MVKEHIRICLLFILCYSVLCTGPSIWVGCRNQTSYHASLYINGTTDGEDEVLAIPSGYHETTLVDNEDIYQWHVRLFDDTGVEVFSDTGQVDIQIGNNRCTVESTGEDEFTVTWTWGD